MVSSDKTERGRDRACKPLREVIKKVLGKGRGPLGV